MPPPSKGRKRATARLSVGRVFGTSAGSDVGTCPCRYPCHFRATRCCVSLLTGPIYGSTLSIPEHFFRPPVEEATIIQRRGETQVEVTSRLSLSRETIPPKWMEQQIETSGGFPRFGPPGIPSGGFIAIQNENVKLRERVKRLKLLPDRPASAASRGARWKI